MNHAQQFAFWGCIGILCTLFWLWGHAACPQCNDLPKYTITYTDCRSDSLTKENVESEIKRFRIKFPAIVYNQVRLETGSLRCKDCSLDKNNLFGFQRDSTGYLCFETWQLSIAKYKFWQEKHWDSTKYNNYYDCLDKCWGADSLYVKHLMQF